MRIAVIGGAGGMGRITTADAAASDRVERVLLVDRDAERAAEIAQAHENVEVRAPGESAADMRAALAGANAVVNAASHRLNLPVM
jgi:saccharopine dehydrogenase-like NADP-dependent oxidoreductase